MAQGYDFVAGSDGVRGEVMPTHTDLVIGLLGPHEVPTSAEIKLISSGKATLRFCIGNAEVQSRLLGRSINWDRVILARKKGQPVGYLSFFMAGYGPFNVGVKPFTDEFGLISGNLRFLVYKFLERRCTWPPCYVYKMVVKGAVRGTGIGSGLMTFLFAHAAARGVSSIDLDVFGKNHNAIYFYKNIGFLQIGEIDFRRFGSFLPDTKILRMKKIMDVS